VHTKGTDQISAVDTSAPKQPRFDKPQPLLSDPALACPVETLRSRRSRRPLPMRVIERIYASNDA
jgi:hypothetical protein